MTDIAMLATELAGRLDRADITGLDQPTVDALDRLFEAVTWERREALDERKRVLWREAASADPDWTTLRRTRLIRELGRGAEYVSDWVLVQRTDTGQFFIVSTGREETYVFPAGADGTRASRYEIPSVSGRGMTRTESVTAVDAHDGELYPRELCPHRRGATDVTSGGWHCYGCGAYLYDDGIEDDDAEITRISD
jgi:hypothetical protein